MNIWGLKRRKLGSIKLTDSSTNLNVVNQNLYVIFEEAMDQIVPDCRSSYDDLTLFGINIVVDDVVTELYGVVDSESDNDVDKDVELIAYLTQANEAVSSQSMARTKQMARKTDKKGELPVNPNPTNPALQSPGGLPLATLPTRRSRRFLESDSELEQAANLYGMDLGSPARSTRSKSPTSARRKSPARSTPGRSPAQGSPGRSSGRSTPARGTPGHGSPMKGVKPGSGRGNSGRSVTPLGSPQAEPKPGTLAVGTRPGQAGYVNRVGGITGARQSSPRWNLPSFSSDDKENDDYDDNEDDDEEEMEDKDYEPGEEDNKDEEDNEDEEEEMEVNFPKIDPKNQRRNNQQTVRAAVKNLNLIRAPKRGVSGFTIIAWWNATACQEKYNETKRGWMAHPQRNAQNQGIRRAQAGMRALQEIRFYQHSTCFLIPMRAFQRVVRQVALDVNGKEFRWQARALFTLQQAAEAYLVAYLGDANLLAIHAHHTTIMKKDMVMVRRMHGRRAIGFDFGDDCGV